MSKYAILINSCDAYSDVWSPFFRILEKTWPEAANNDIYLNTETKSYTDCFFNVHVLNNINNAKSWGERLINAVNRIGNDYVLFILEDFFFEQPVLDSAIKDGLECLEGDKRIACISFNSELECSDSTYCKNNSKSIIKGFIPKKQFAYFKISAGPSLWRKRSLLKWTFLNDSPWEWEFFGSLRTWLSRDFFYGRCYDAPPIFVYDIEHGGAIHRGKWVGYKMRELQIKYDLPIDTVGRGVIEDWKADLIKTHPKPYYKRVSSILKNRFKMLCNIVFGFFIGLSK